MVTKDVDKDIEKACIGGCIASLRIWFDNYYYQCKDDNFRALFVIGAGVPIGSDICYFDRDARGFWYIAAGECALHMIEVFVKGIPVGIKAGKTQNELRAI